MNIEEKVQNRMNSLCWAKQGFEVAKYNPCLYNNGIYLDNTEWTDYFDVGKYVSYKDYETIEKQYIDVVLDIVDLSNCKYLTLIRLNMYEKELYMGISTKKKIYTSHEGKRIVFKYNNSDLLLMKEALSLNMYHRISPKKIPNVVKMLLRGFIFASLINESRKIQFDFPGNFYLWIHCKNVDYILLKKIVESHDLYLDPRDGS